MLLLMKVPKTETSKFNEKCAIQLNIQQCASMMIDSSIIGQE